MKVFFSFLFFSFFCGILIGQDPSLAKNGPLIRFHHTKFHYGKLKEDLGQAIHRFTFTNVGNKPLKITNVHSSCGCTTPNWSQDSIQPGDSGFVETSYETYNRIGEFAKTVTVYSNASNAPFVHLDISGEVEPSAIPDIQAELFPQVLFVKNSDIQLGIIYDNQLDTFELDIANLTHESVIIEQIPDLPSFMSIIAKTDTIASMGSAKLAILVDGRKIKRYGFESHNISIVTNSRISKYIGASVSFNKKQYFPRYNARQLAKQPKAAFDKSVHDFDSAASGSILISKFTLSNKGKKDLVIHEVLPDCSCLKVDYHKNIIPPGESIEMTLTWDTVLKNGRKYQNVYFIVNDPVNPEVKITVTAALPEKKNGGCLSCPK